MLNQQVTALMITNQVEICIKYFFPILGDRESSYESFLEKLKIVNGAEKECRYGLFDFEYTHQCQGTQEVRN